MATYYVDPVNGNDADDGLSWADAFLTLNGAEDEPVVANDTVYVGPGVYREELTVDVSGSAGNPITYIADVTGENTDSVGGVVRITGSDNDTTLTRNEAIDNTTFTYRTFRGFSFDFGWVRVTGNGVTNWIIEDCAFLTRATGSTVIRLEGECDDMIIRRCVFFETPYAVTNDLAGAYAGSGNLIENCLILGGTTVSILIDRSDGWTVRNCSFFGSSRGVNADGLNSNGYTINVNNCTFYACKEGLRADAIGGITEDYNAFYANATDRVLTNTGANSNAYPALPTLPILFDGIKFPWQIGELSEWSQIAAITGANEPTEDLRGIARPVTAAKNSWGAVQFADTERETTTKHAGSASIKFNDAGRHQIWVPVEASSTTIAVYVYREANYAGNNPQMIVKQPGQADDVTTDVAAASQWNELTTTLTPAALPPYVIVELVSRNTDAANPATNDVFFDDLTVT